MFPSLRSLLISRNSLWSLSLDNTNTAGRPAALAASWTQATNPIAFKAMDFLVVYPGNENICFLPDGTDRTLPDGTTFYGNGESFQDINGGEAAGKPLGVGYEQECPDGSASGAASPAHALFAVAGAWVGVSTF